MYPKKSLPIFRLQRFFSYFSSRSFRFSAYSLRSLIHFELYIIYILHQARVNGLFIYLSYMYIQFFQQHLLEGLSFIHELPWQLSQNEQTTYKQTNNPPKELTIDIWTYFLKSNTISPPTLLFFRIV